MLYIPKVTRFTHVVKISVNLLTSANSTAGNRPTNDHAQ